MSILERLFKCDKPSEKIRIFAQFKRIVITEKSVNMPALKQAEMWAKNNPDRVTMMTLRSHYNTSIARQNGTYK